MLEMHRHWRQLRVDLAGKGKERGKNFQIFRFYKVQNTILFLGKLWVKMSKKGQEKQVPDFHMDAIKEEESCLKCIDIGGN